MIVTTPEQLAAALTAAPLPAAGIARVEILLDGAVVQTLGPDELQATPFGLAFATTLAGLSTAAAASNALEVVVTPADGSGAGSRSATRSSAPAAGPTG